MADIASLLLVEDDNVDVVAVRRALGSLGYAGAVALANSVAEAQARLRVATPDLILLDLNMVGHSGHELLAFLRARTTESASGALVPPVVVLTSSSDAAERDRCFAAGVVGYFVKPVAWLDLLETLRAVLAYWERSLRPAANS